MYRPLTMLPEHEERIKLWQAGPRQPSTGGLTVILPTDVITSWGSWRHITSDYDGMLKGDSLDHLLEKFEERRFELLQRSHIERGCDGVLTAFRKDANGVWQPLA